jgi:hypothetical protein
VIDRRTFLGGLPLTALAAGAPPSPVTAAVRTWNGKPTLHIREKPVYASFYALTDCLGGRYSWEEGPRQSIRQFVEAGFKLFQLDLFLEECWTAPGSFSIELARKQIRGVLDLCPEAAVVLRWHVNAPKWWMEQNPGELTRYANGDFEKIERTVPVRIIQDDLRRSPRASLASEKWMQAAKEKTAQLLQALSRTPESNALAGIHVACGVYGEWHYWGFMRNEPDTSAPMQAYFDRHQSMDAKQPVRIPSLEERKALDDGIFRDPKKRAAVIDYYRCQQELVADRILELCALVKRHWPRPIVTGTFYGYFFSMFDRQATGGHLCLHKLLASPHVDYLSAPQAYGTLFRDLGGSGVTRALVESIRANGKLFLDEMDQTPSWAWQNNVDTAFRLTDLDLDRALIRRNVLESYTRGAGLWYYDFGPANQSGWWQDFRLMAEIKGLREILDRYHQKRYEPAGDILYVFDTEVFYFTGSIQGTDPVTDTKAVNRTIGEAYRSGAAIETIHLQDLFRIDLNRFKVIVFANTWLLTSEQRKQIRMKVSKPGRRIVFQGPAGYCDGVRLSKEFTEELLAIPGARHFPDPPLTAASLREVAIDAGAHLYTDEEGDIIHAGGGLVLIHSKAGGKRQIRFRSGVRKELILPPKSSWIFDALTGELLLP